MSESGSEGAEIYKQKQEKKSIANGSQSAENNGSETTNNISQFPKQNRERKGFLNWLIGKKSNPNTLNAQQQIGEMPKNITPIGTPAMNKELNPQSTIENLSENPTLTGAHPAFQKEEAAERLANAQPNPSYGTGENAPGITAIPITTMTDETEEAKDEQFRANQQMASPPQPTEIPAAQPIPDSAVADEVDKMLNQPVDNVSQLPNSQNSPPDKPAA